MLSHLQLLHLADSALPIGAVSHSFGLESLTAENHVTPENLFEHLRGLLEESLLLDAVYCRAGYQYFADPARLQTLNHRLSAARLPRESRQASLILGRRLVTLVATLHQSEILKAALELDELHWPIAFGLIAAALQFDLEITILSLLHQSILNAISAAQRLLPLGQAEASRIAWNLKPHILEAARQSAALDPGSVPSFSQLPELASMRHPNLATRLFIS